MGLVDYSDSEGSGPGSGSEAEVQAPVKPAPKPSASSKKPFQKVVDRSNPGKIVVSLPQLANDKPETEEPPGKRTKTAGTGRFSGFNSFLPAPKNANKPQPVASSSSTARSTFQFKTSAAPGFSREIGGDLNHSEDNTEGMSLSTPKTVTQPHIPEGQKPADEVKLVGKPLMFKPLSVARNPQKKKKLNSGLAKPAPTPTYEQTPLKPAEATPEVAPAVPKKVSLFSLHTEEPSEPAERSSSGTYEPMFATVESSLAYDEGAYGDYASHAQAGPSATTLPGSESLDTVVEDLNLTAAQRRELFGRNGLGNQAAKKVINFNMDKEYRHNEEIRAAGEEQTHNPVRAIQGGGKHSLRQLVQNAQNQREALEDSFAKGKNNRREAGSKYGW
ncbi:stress activated map kinase interacting [Fusarium sp. NRRL 52700]|nr:stress activated map kinase interacting [Fusarium sp. NRRL 52700]